MKYFFFAMFVWLCLFPKSGHSQEQVQTFRRNVSPSIYLHPAFAVQPTKLPLEWRGATVFFDAANKFDAKFSAMNYSFGGSAMIGYKQYGLRAEALAPLSAQGWTYRIKLEYQVF